MNNKKIWAGFNGTPTPLKKHPPRGQLCELMSAQGRAG